MKLKLTSAEFTGLFQLFLVFVMQAEPKTMEHKLLHSILISIYVKLYKKNIEKKRSYRIGLQDHEALAFFLFFQKIPVPQTMVFEANIVRRISDSIHQKFIS